MDHTLKSAKETFFSDIKAGQKFATAANNKIIVWTKIHNFGAVFKSGDSDDGWTAPMGNALSDCGFEATFAGASLVCPVSTTRWVVDS